MRMRVGWRASAVGVLVAAGVAAVLAAPTDAASARKRAPTIRVGSDAGFQRAEQKLRRSGGTIVLRPRLYRRLTISARSNRPLRIVGTRGARVEDVYFYGARRVSFGRVRIGPIRGDALVEIWRSTDIVLHDLVVSAAGTRRSASVLLADGHRLTVRDSDFSHCGDRHWDFVNCVTLYRWTHGITIEGNRFHDCRGCDFVHGRFGTSLSLRGNRFERSLPCRINPHRCGHQDLVQLFAGRRLRVVGNRFGVYKSGGAQLYLTNTVDHATVVNNVFAATDPRVPDYRVRMGIVIGSNASRRLPHYARVLNNTILSGARRRDGYAGSIRMSSRYGGVQRWKRPIVANNVIALLETPGRVCLAAQRFVRNVVIRGRSCREPELVGDAGLDGRGRPRAVSSVIDVANRHYAPPTDVTGRPRGGAPDIGAFEYRH